MRLTRVSCVFLTAFVCLAFACDKDKPEAPTVSGAQPVVSSKPKVERPLKRMRPKRAMASRGRRLHNEPAGMLLHAAMKAPELKDDQKTKLEALRPNDRGEGMKGKMGLSGGRDKFLKAWLDGIKAGKVSEKAFGEHTDEMRKKIDERTAARAKLLNDMHAILTPEQRKSVAQTIRERMEHGEAGKDKAKERPMDDLPDKGEPGEGRRRPMVADRLGGPGLGPKGGRYGRNRMRPPGFDFMRMSRRLDLTEDQKKKLGELAETMKADRPSEEERKARREAAKKNLMALLEAFEKDSFDATKLDISKRGDPGAGMKKHIERFNAFLAILTEEQRTKLAEAFEKRHERIPDHDEVNEYDEIVDEVDLTPPG